MIKNNFLRKLLLAGVSISISVLSLTNCSEKPEPVIQPKIPNQFGLAVEDLIEVRDTIKPDETFSDILLPHSVSQQRINELEKKALDVFPLRNIRADDELFIYAKWDSVETVNYIVYKNDVINFTVFDLRDTIKVYKSQRPFTVKQTAVSSSSINGSLIQTLIDKGVDKNVGYAMADIYESQIDLGILQENDGFDVIFEEIYVDDKPAGVGKVLASRFNFGRKDYYAIRFDKEKAGSYFDENGKGLAGMFLKAPIKLKYRITSRYSSNRYHPILHRNKSHLGTDYAAPAGTPIQTVANGVVLEASYTSGNGNYVKIKHNGTYTTQYLHMSRFAKGIHRGVRVTQGQIIGFVGSTGLATGPHVCFRFWKNGRQVNPLREKNQSSEPVSKKNKAEYEVVKKEWMQKLQATEAE